MNESAHTYERVIAHIWTGQIMYTWTRHGTHQCSCAAAASPHMNESLHTYKRVMAHIWMSHAAHKCNCAAAAQLRMDESLHICKRVMAHIQKSHGTHMDESPHTLEKSHCCCPRTAWCVVNMFHKNGMRPLIITNGTICYSVLYCNSPRLDIRLKYMYYVISVKLDWLPDSSKK